VQFLDPNKGEKLESSTGRVASRDMIQFAPMKDEHGMLVDQNLISLFPSISSPEKMQNISFAYFIVLSLIPKISPS
jgi:hypothetical protein